MPFDFDWCRRRPSYYSYSEDYEYSSSVRCRRYSTPPSSRSPWFSCSSEPRRQSTIVYSPRRKYHSHYHFPPVERHYLSVSRYYSDDDDGDDDDSVDFPHSGKPGSQSGVVEARERPTAGGFTLPIRLELGFIEVLKLWVVLRLFLRL